MRNDFWYYVSIAQELITFDQGRCYCQPDPTQTTFKDQDLRHTESEGRSREACHPIELEGDS